MRDFVTTILDASGLLLLAAGVAGGTWPYVGGFALAFAGLVVLVGSWLATRGSSS